MINLNGIIDAGISAVTRVYASLSQPRLLTTNITQIEIAIIEGDLFITHQRFTLGDGESLFLKFTAPPEGKTFALIKRELTPEVAGIEYNVRTGFSGGTLSGTLWTTYNENGYFEGVKTSDATFETYSVAPTVLGDIVDLAWIPPTAQGPRITGVVNPDSGFKVVKYDEELLIEVINTSGVSNEIVLKYGWV